MTRLLLALMMLMPLAALAASPEAAYLAARDKYIDKFKELDANGTIDDAAVAEQDAAIEDLGKLLRQVIGPFSAEGYSGEGNASLESLFPSDIGFGLLDGLVYAADDEKGELLVTTQGLLNQWLTALHDLAPDIANVPATMEGALGSEVFYTQAISVDAAVGKYADIPIVKHGNASFAFAMLDARSQDIGPRVPDELIVSVVSGDRVFLVSADVDEAASIPACDKIWQDFERKAEEAYAAYTASDTKDEKLFDAYTKIQEDGDSDFHRCFAERAKDAAFLPALTKRAQEIADRLSK